MTATYTIKFNPGQHESTTCIASVLIAMAVAIQNTTMKKYTVTHDRNKD